MQAKSRRVFKGSLVRRSHNKKRGGVVHTQDNRLGTPQGVSAQGFARQVYTNHGFTTETVANQGFTTADILWALGIWSAIICLSLVIIFYMLMVA
jgi:hypothetical protein